MAFDEHQQALLWSLELNRRRLAGVNRRLKRLPEERSALEDGLRRVEERLAALERRLQELQVKQQRLELEVEDARSRQQKHRAHLLAARDNREYHTLLKSIETEVERQGTLEESILEVMEELEALQSELSRARRDVAETGEKARDGLARLDAESRGLAEELKLCQERRSGLVSELDPESLRLLAKLESRGAASGICSLVENYKCGVCGMEVATQILSQVHAGHLRQCDSCSAILFDEDRVALARKVARARGYLGEQSLPEE